MYGMCGHTLFLPQLWALICLMEFLHKILTLSDQVFLEMKHGYVVEYKTKTGSNNISDPYL